MSWVIVVVWTILILGILHIEFYNARIVMKEEQEEEEMAYTQQTFLEQIRPYVIQDMIQTGILASLTASQALIESNKGNSGLAVKANNLFGIKGKYNGQCVSMMTTEYYGGKPCRVLADFRKYPSWAESIADHSALFNKNKRYENLRNCQDYEEACINVKKDGYATSPTYTNTLMNPIKKFKLWMWDYEVLKYYAPEKLRTVRKGSDGGGVYLLQECLNRQGYGLTMDGNFGPATEGAVIAFQEKDGLTADGIVGQKTWKALRK